MNEKLKILILDDDSFIRRALSEILSRRYEILLARNYAEFKDVIAVFKPHILFLDLNLPDSHGIDICRNLRRGGEYADLFILILTGSTEENIIEEGYAAGADDFIRKPFIPYEIKSKIAIFEKIIRGKKGLEEAYAEQLAHNRKLNIFEEILRSNIVRSDNFFSPETIDKLHEIINFDHFEAVEIREGEDVSLIKRSYNNSGGYPAFDEMKKRISLDVFKGAGIKTFQIKKKKTMLHSLIAPVYLNTVLYGYIYMLSGAVFKKDELKIFQLYLEYINLINDRFLMEKMLKHKNKEYKQEISKIRKIQVSLLPDFSNIVGYEIAASYLPAQELSGDFFDGFFIDSDVYQLILCDISGHGMASAYIGNEIRTLFRVASKNERSLAAVTKIVSDAMQGDLKDMAYFGTVIICQIHLKEGKIKYLNAGHPPALYYNNKKEYRNIIQTGPLVGLFSDNEYDEIELVMEEGDCLFLYTDGIVEASSSYWGKKDEMYGEKRLEENFIKAQGLSSRNIIHSILGTVYEFIDYTDQGDDITAICIRKDKNVGGAIIF